MNNTKLWLSNQLLDLFFYVPDEIINLTATERSILLSISKFSHHETLKCHPSLKSLAKITGLKERAIRTNLRNLESKKILTCSIQYDKAGDFSSNLYTISKLKIAEWVGHLKPHPVSEPLQPAKNVQPGGGAFKTPGVGHLKPPNYKDITNNRTKREALSLPTSLSDHSFDELKDMASSLELDWQKEVDMFKDNALSTGKKLIDWNAGFRNWLRKSYDFKMNAKPSLKLVPQAPPAKHYPGIEEIRLIKEAERLKQSALDEQLKREIQSYSRSEIPTKPFPSPILDAIKKPKESHNPIAALEIMRQRLLSEGKI